MSENAGGQGSSSAGDKPAGTAPNPAAPPAPKSNPAFRALGLPNFRLRLPSRNWMIFLTVVSSWTGAVVYDRRQKKAAQKKWCTLVEHIAQESLPTNSVPRRVTIVLAAPPGDGLRVAREHFTEYVKPVLVAGALDWDVIEGRREGEVRAGLAEKIRRLRRKAGEPAETSVERDVTMALDEMRARTGIQDYQGQNGDIVIGRHTWKEYVRGLHEGWLGPIDPPKAAEEPPPSLAPESSSPPTTDQPVPSGLDAQSEPQADDSSPTTTSPETPAPEATASNTEEKKEEEKKPEKPARAPVKPAHNTTSSYTDSPLAISCPSEFPASNAIPMPHLLGVINTPIRVYRFLTKRHLADDVGRQTAAAVLAAHRPYQHGTGPQMAAGEEKSSEFSAETMDEPTSRPQDEKWEQQRLLAHEEPEWYKSARKRVEGEGERAWLDEMVVDPRIGSRMKRFELEPKEEERARRIAKGATGSPGRRAGDDDGLQVEGGS